MAGRLSSVRPLAASSASPPTIYRHLFWRYGQPRSKFSSWQQWPSPLRLLSASPFRLLQSPSCTTHAKVQATLPHLPVPPPPSSLLLRHPPTPPPPSHAGFLFASSSPAVVAASGACCVAPASVLFSASPRALRSLSRCPLHTAESAKQCCRRVGA